MKSFAELIENRRSIRQFSEEQLLPEDVQALMTAALRAPSGRNRQQTRYILVEDRDKLQVLSLMKQHGSRFLADAALAVVVLGSPMFSERWHEDAAIAATSNCRRRIWGWAVAGVRFSDRLHRMGRRLLSMCAIR